MKISDPSFKFVISNSRRFKYIVELDLVWTNTGLILILYSKTPKSILLYGKLLFTWLSLVVSVMVSFCAVLFPTRCLG